MAVDFGKMIGPLPLGAWVAVVGGGLGLMVYTRRQSATKQTPANPDQLPEDTGTTPGVGVGGSGLFVPVTPPANGTSDTNTAETNDDWGVMAISYLNAKGYPAGPVNSAVTKFLNQQQMDGQEYSLIGIALAHFGSPPTPVQGPFGPGAVVPPIGGTTPPTSAPRWPLPHAPYFTYIIQPRDTLATIASHYGTTQQNLYLWNAVALDYRARKTGNKTSSRGGMYIYAGTPLTIPWGLRGQHYTP